MSSAAVHPVTPLAAFPGVAQRLSVGSTPRQPASTPRLRITRRGRTALSVLVALPLALMLALGAQQAIAGSGSAVGDTAFHYVTVEAGQTLWALAGELAPSADPREVVAEIAQLNGLGGTAIQPGQRLAIPHAYAP